MFNLVKFILVQFIWIFSTFDVIEKFPLNPVLLTSLDLDIITKLKSSEEEKILFTSEQLPKSTSCNEGLFINIPLCSSTLFNWKADKFNLDKYPQSINIPAVFWREEVFKFSKPFNSIKLLHPANKKSISVTCEVISEVKSTFCKFLQFVKVYIILVIEGELILLKSILIISIQPSNIKSKFVKGFSKVTLIFMIPVLLGIIIPLFISIDSSLLKFELPIISSAK